METEESPGLQSASWRPGTMGAGVSSLSPKASEPAELTVKFLLGSHQA